MDIGQFLSTGKTYIHATAKSILPKTGMAVVLSLAMLANTQADTQYSTVTAMPHDTATLSRVYQGIAAPHNENVLVVSAQSKQLLNIISSMPEVMRQQTERRIAQGMLSSERRDAHVQKTIGKALFGPDQVVCIVNAMETINAQTYALNNHAAWDGNMGDGVRMVQSMNDALFATTIHELTHCVTSAPSINNPALSDYATVQAEATADLAVVLAYASLEGHTANGLAVVNGLRAGIFDDPAHATDDLVPLLLQDADINEVYGKPLHEVLEYAAYIAEQADMMDSATYRSAWAKTIMEKLGAGERALGENPTLKADLESSIAALGNPRYEVNIDQRIAQIFDAKITLDVKNAHLHHAPDMSPLKDYEALAHTFGIELPISQQLRIASFDATITPSGPATSPHASDAQLSNNEHINKVIENALNNGLHNPRASAKTKAAAQAATLN